MDIWEIFEQGAVAALEREVSRTPVDRETLTKGLHLLAIAKANDAAAPMPPLDIFTDAELVDIVNSLLEDNRDQF